MHRENGPILKRMEKIYSDDEHTHFNYVACSFISLIGLILISLLSLFRKNKFRCMRSPCCLCIYVAPPPFWMPKPIFIKLRTYIMVSELISTAYFIISSHQSVCLYVCPLWFLGNCSVKTLQQYCGNEYIRNNRRIVGRVVFYAVLILPKESRLLVLSRSSLLPTEFCWWESSSTSGIILNREKAYFYRILLNIYH
jgi:hypothetical protein